jgi:predicted DNA-binding protein YlxM (UPF0122 family)
VKLTRRQIETLVENYIFDDTILSEVVSITSWTDPDVGGDCQTNIRLPSAAASKKLNKALSKFMKLGLGASGPVCDMITTLLGFPLAAKKDKPDKNQTAAQRTQGRVFIDYIDIMNVEEAKLNLFKNYIKASNVADKKSGIEKDREVLLTLLNDLNQNPQSALKDVRKFFGNDIKGKNIKNSKANLTALQTAGASNSQLIALMKEEIKSIAKALGRQLQRRNPSDGFITSDYVNSL